MHTTPNGTKALAPKFKTTPTENEATILTTIYEHPLSETLPESIRRFGPLDPRFGCRGGPWINVPVLEASAKQLVMTGCCSWFMDY